MTKNIKKTHVITVQKLNERYKPTSPSKSFTIHAPNLTYEEISDKIKEFLRGEKIGKGY